MACNCSSVGELGTWRTSHSRRQVRPKKEIYIDLRWRRRLSLNGRLWFVGGRVRQQGVFSACPESCHPSTHEIGLKRADAGGEAEVNLSQDGERCWRSTRETQGPKGQDTLASDAHQAAGQMHDIVIGSRCSLFTGEQRSCQKIMSRGMDGKGWLHAISRTATVVNAALGPGTGNIVLYYFIHQPPNAR